MFDGKWRRPLKRLYILRLVERQRSGLSRVIVPSDGAYALPCGRKELEVRMRGHQSPVKQY